jgi:hypothetical protein
VRCRWTRFAAACRRPSTRSALRVRRVARHHDDGSVRRKQPVR